MFHLEGWTCPQPPPLSAAETTSTATRREEHARCRSSSGSAWNSATEERQRGVSRGTTCSTGGNLLPMFCSEKNPKAAHHSATAIQTRSRL